MREAVKQGVRQAAVVALMLAALLLFFFWLFFYSGNVLATPVQNAPNRAAIVRMYNAVSVGDSYRSVLEAYFREATQETKLIVVTPRMIRIVTPHEIGFQDWVLVAEFTGDSVSAVRVITSDGPPPVNGPKDKVH